MKKKDIKKNFVDYAIVFGVSAIAVVLIFASAINMAETPVQSVSGMIVGGMWLTCAAIANKKV